MQNSIIPESFSEIGVYLCLLCRAASKELQTFRLQRAPTKEGAPTSWRKAWNLNCLWFYSEARAERIQLRVFTSSFSDLIRS